MNPASIATDSSRIQAQTCGDTAGRLDTSGPRSLRLRIRPEIRSVGGEIGVCDMGAYGIEIEALVIRPAALELFSFDALAHGSELRLHTVESSLKAGVVAKAVE